MAFYNNGPDLKHVTDTTALRLSGLKTRMAAISRQIGYAKKASVSSLEPFKLTKLALESAEAKAKKAAKAFRAEKVASKKQLTIDLAELEGDKSAETIEFRQGLIADADECISTARGLWEAACEAVAKAHDDFEVAAATADEKSKTLYGHLRAHARLTDEKAEVESDLAKLREKYKAVNVRKNEQRLERETRAAKREEMATKREHELEELRTAARRVRELFAENKDIDAINASVSAGYNKPSDLMRAAGL